MTPTLAPSLLDHPAPTESLDLDLAGMTCAACVRHIDKALRSVAGVRDADVNLVTQRARVVIDGGRVDVAELAAAVERAGYEVIGAGERVPVPQPAIAKPADAPLPAAVSPATQAAQRSSARERVELAERKGLRRDLVLATILTVPLVAMAMSHGAWPWTETVAGRWTQLVLATPVVFLSGARFLGLAWRAARRISADMNTLVAIGALAAWSYSAVALALPGLFTHAEHGVLPHLYFEASATIVTFVLFGKLLEARARRHLGDAVRGLHALVPALARRRKGDREEDVPVADLRANDEVLVRPGERIPSDGVVIEGASAID